MKTEQIEASRKAWDVIVIGSGIGGLASAAALAKYGYRVLVLEQHTDVGGCTQSFSRQGFTWNVGVHYLSDMGAEGEAGWQFSWLSDNAIKFASLGPVYDVIRLPDHFEIPFSRPQSSLMMDLKERFPTASGEIDAYFNDLEQAEQAARFLSIMRSFPAVLGEIYSRRKRRDPHISQELLTTLQDKLKRAFPEAKTVLEHYFNDLARREQAAYDISTAHTLPTLLAGVYSHWQDANIQYWCGQTLGEILEKRISDPKLRMVLAAQWHYGGLPWYKSFGAHAMLTRSYFNGAYYPVGGAKIFAETLVPVIEKAEGKVLLGSRVASLFIEDGCTVGVKLEKGDEYQAKHVISAIGAYATVERLLPKDLRQSNWVRELLSLQPAVGHISLFLGFEGDIHAHGATVSNQIIYETWEPHQVLWQDPLTETRAPCCFVSFPSLRDPQHEQGNRQKHTGDVLVLAPWEVFRAQTENDYPSFKRRLEQRLLAQFKHYFPCLAPLIVYHELATPLDQDAPRGAIYGMAATPKHLLAKHLRVEMPIRGLYLAGQDVMRSGVSGAMQGGLLAAAAIEPRIHMVCM